MTNQTRAWSWRHAIIKSSLPATTRHVLLTISCFMNELGEGCYPTQDQLAEATGLTDRAVRSHLEVAESAGWIKRQEHGFKGQKWRNHEYSAAWPETQDVDKGAERGSSASSQRCGTTFQKVRNDVPTTTPYTTPEKASAFSARKRRAQKTTKSGWVQPRKMSDAVASLIEEIEQHGFRRTGDRVEIAGETVRLIPAVGSR